MKRFIQREIETRIAYLLIEQDVAPHATIVVDVEDGAFVLSIVNANNY
ncbi:hypothetical protein MGH68_08965 [Erysipelothrix sp. D19-032]